MKHSYQVIGVDHTGRTIGCCCVAKDIMDVINICRSECINPHTIIQMKQINPIIKCGLYPLDLTEVDSFVH